MDRALLVTEVTEQLSLADGLPRVTLVAAQPALAETVRSAGQVIMGAVVLVVTEVTEQLSLVRGLPRFTLVAAQPALAEMARWAGHVIVGALVSNTITRWMQELVLPLESVTVQVTRLVPSG